MKHIVGPSRLWGAVGNQDSLMDAHAQNASEVNKSGINHQKQATHVSGWQKHA